MTKISENWHSDRLGRRVQVSRWGEVGRPVLIFPTAAGDADECERFLMIDALGELLSDGLIKAYSVDSVAGQVLLEEDNSSHVASHMQERFLEFIFEEVVPAIRTDCGGDDTLEIILAGASIGAFNALASICLHPDVFSHAYCMSGTYDTKKFMEGEPTESYRRVAPLNFVPSLEEGSPHLARLRKRSVLFSHGQGRWEDPEQSWIAANCLGARGIPNHVDAWGDEYDHDWPTWRKMLPGYLKKLLAPDEDK